jgi:hypothetical protein
MTKNKSTEITNLAKKWLETKHVLKELEEDFGNLDGLLKEAMISMGLKSIQVDGVTIELNISNRRSFDASILKSLVSPSLFNKVTKPTVDTTLIDSAVKMGAISEEVLSNITKNTEIKRLLEK